MTHLIVLPFLGWFLSLISPREITVSDSQFVGGVPRLTTDADGHPLLSWVEKDVNLSASFYFAVSKDEGRTFGPKVRVQAPATMATHAEGMPKIAVKADGTLLAVFELPQPTPESRFASDLLYTLSTDNGETWSAATSVHQEVKAVKNRRPPSRSFADVSRLPNGEIGIVWLDEKLPNQEGRPVLFAQTTKGSGFGPPVVVDENACQCCRTSVFVDAQKRVYLTYRDLLPAKAGEPAYRDISTVVSTDGGKTFGKPKVVLADHWQVNACPHAGPVVAQLGDDLLITWLSGKENNAGLRLAQLGKNQLTASVLTSRAKHPQISAAGEWLAWVWDESIAKDDSGEMGSFVQRIGLRTFDGKNVSATTYLTPESVNAAYPAVLAMPKATLVVYEQTGAKQSAVIVVQRLTKL